MSEVAMSRLAARVAALTNQVAELRAACEAVEWVDVDPHYRVVECPRCGRQHVDEVAKKLRAHADGCQLAAALANTEDA